MDTSPVDEDELSNTTPVPEDQAGLDQRPTRVRQQPTRLAYFAPGQPYAMQATMNNMDYSPRPMIFPQPQNIRIPVWIPLYCWPIPTNMYVPTTLHVQQTCLRQWTVRELILYIVILYFYFRVYLSEHHIVH